MMASTKMVAWRSQSHASMKLPFAAGLQLREALHDKACRYLLSGEHRCTGHFLRAGNTDRRHWHAIRDTERHARLGRLRSWTLPPTVRAMRVELASRSERLPARIPSRLGRERVPPQPLRQSFCIGARSGAVSPWWSGEAALR